MKAHPEVRGTWLYVPISFCSSSPNSWHGKAILNSLLSSCLASQLPHGELGPEHRPAAERIFQNKHPANTIVQVTKLMGHEPRTKYVALSVVLIQLTTAFLLRHTHPLSWKFLAAAYIIGGTANHNLFLAIHEITHNLAFKGVKANKALAIIVNLPIGVPYAVTFKVSVRVYTVWACRGDCNRDITWSITSTLVKMAWTQICPHNWSSYALTMSLGKCSSGERRCLRLIAVLIASGG